MRSVVADWKYIFNYCLDFTGNWFLPHQAVTSKFFCPHVQVLLFSTSSVLETHITYGKFRHRHFNSIDQIWRNNFMFNSIVCFSAHNYTYCCLICVLIIAQSKHACSLFLRISILILNYMLVFLHSQISTLFSSTTLYHNRCPNFLSHGPLVPAATSANMCTSETTLFWCWLSGRTSRLLVSLSALFLFPYSPPPPPSVITTHTEASKRG